MSRARIYTPAKKQIVQLDQVRVRFPKWVNDQHRDASAHYDKTLQVFTTAGINLSSDTIKFQLLRSSAYTFSQAHDFRDDWPATIVTNVTAGSKSVSLGTFDAADAVFASVGAGAAIDAVGVYKDVGSAATDNIICYIDGFSVTPNGGDITLQWAASTPFIFKI